jgi:ankyrin repeat protein
MLEADASLAGATDSQGWTPLHIAVAMRSEPVVAWLLGHGADVNRAGPGGQTPLEFGAGKRWKAPASAESFARIAASLRDRGALLTARAAAALGEALWLRARHDETALVDTGTWRTGGLLTVAVKHKQAECLRLLLDFGLDSNEPVRLEELEEEIYSRGAPLWHAAALGELPLAELLLGRGADPNAMVYASGTPVYSAYGQHDQAMVELLLRHGGKVGAETFGHYRETEKARRLLSEAVDPRAVAEQLLWSAACGGDPEIVRMALAHLDWPASDERWFWALGQPLRLWNHMDGHWANPALDRSTYTECFRLVLERCDPNLRHPRFGRTMLHDVAAFSGRMTPEEQRNFTTMLLDAGARLNERDALLLSTPLGWACRWGCIEMVKMLIGRGAEVLETGAEPWATPLAWAEKKGRREVMAVLRSELARGQ